MTEQEARAEAQAKAEAEQRYPEGLYAGGDFERGSLRAGFVEGWLASRKVVAAPSDTDRAALLVRIQREMESYDPETLGDDPTVFDSWKLLYDLKAALESSSRPVQVEVTNAMVERAAVAAWGATMPGGFVAEPWNEADEADREDARAQMRAALKAALGGDEND